jgi:hypothetical protein
MSSKSRCFFMFRASDHCGMMPTELDCQSSVDCVSHHRDTADALWLVASTIALAFSLQKALPFQLLPQQSKASSKHDPAISVTPPAQHPGSTCRMVHRPAVPRHWG